jgi:anti-anti-sigma factor
MLRSEAGILDEVLQSVGGSQARVRRHAAPNLDVEIEKRPQGYVVRLDGDAGILEAETLETELTLLLVHRPELVVFDLSNLGYVSSITLGLLINFRRAVMRHGGKLRLAGVQPLVREIFERTGLTRLFPMTRTVEAALHA